MLQPDLSNLPRRRAESFFGGESPKCQKVASLVLDRRGRLAAFAKTIYPAIHNLEVQIIDGRIVPNELPELSVRINEVFFRLRANSILMFQNTLSMQLNECLHFLSP